MWLRISLAVAALLVAGAAAAFAFDWGPWDDSSGDGEGEVPAQVNSITSDQVQTRQQRWRQDRRPPFEEAQCEVPRPKVEATRHDAWVEVTYTFETLPRSRACRPDVVVGVLISGAPEEGRLVSLSRTVVKGRTGTLVLSRRPLRGRPPKRADISGLAISGTSSAVVSVPVR